MVKINLKYSIALVIIISNIFAYTNSYGITNEPGFVYGKVVYSDDQSPVSIGVIKVFKTNNPGNVGRILEVTDIQANGVFKLSKKNIQNTDGIKIMAYVNDLDELSIMAYVNDFGNHGQPFETTVIDAENAFSNSDKEYAIIIEVDRIKDYKSKSLKDSKVEGVLLKQNYPNPFNPTTLIRFELPQTSNVTLKVYNMNGEAVATLVENKNLTSGLNEFEFNASSLPSGIYVYTLYAGDYNETRKMMLLK